MCHKTGDNTARTLYICPPWHMLYLVHLHKQLIVLHSISQNSTKFLNFTQWKCRKISQVKVPLNFAEFRVIVPKIPPQKKYFRTGRHRTLDSEDRKVVVTCNEFAWVPVTTAGSTKFWLVRMGVIQYSKSVLCALSQFRGSRSVRYLQGFSCVKFLRYRSARFPYAYQCLLIFWRYKVCWPLLCLYRPFCIFHRCLGSNPRSCRSK